MIFMNNPNEIQGTFSAHIRIQRRLLTISVSCAHGPAKHFRILVSGQRVSSQTRILNGEQREAGFDAGQDAISPPALHRPVTDLKLKLRPWSRRIQMSDVA